jgi:hypothetical protein
MQRGMTLAPRVQVYTQLSCNVLHQNYNHTNSLLFPSPTSSYIPNALSPVVISNAHPFRPNLPIHDPAQLCSSDPAVQAGAARLQTAFMVIMGVLSVLTTSFWGHFGERHGRTRVLALSSLGLLITYVNTTNISYTHSCIYAL